MREQFVHYEQIVHSFITFPDSMLNKFGVVKKAMYRKFSTQGRIIMKRFITIVFLLTPVLLNAGVIMKKTGERIEDVSIQSVSGDSVLYIDENNSKQTMPANEIQAVLYDDGRYVEIRTSTAIPTKGSTVTEDIEAETNRLAKEQKQREEAEKKQAQEAAKLEALEKTRIEAEEARLATERECQDGMIHKLSANKFYFEDRYYIQKDIKSIILSCPDAKTKYVNGRKWALNGWTTCGVSFGILLTGCILMPLGITQLNYGSGGGDGLIIGGIVCISAGSVGMATGITIACIGHYRMNNAYKVYNEHCAVKRESVLSMNLGVTRNGIGLIMNF